MISHPSIKIAERFRLRTDVLYNMREDTFLRMYLYQTGPVRLHVGYPVFSNLCTLPLLVCSARWQECDFDGDLCRIRIKCEGHAEGPIAEGLHQNGGEVNRIRNRIRTVNVVNEII